VVWTRLRDEDMEEAEAEAEEGRRDEIQGNMAVLLQ
jgi:hypothetical protein